MNDRVALWLYRIGMILLGLALCLLLWGIALHADAQDTAAGAVCAPGNVKFEVGSGYEYTDNTATVIVTPDGLTTEWQGKLPSLVTFVCVKIGGPGGGTLVYPDPATMTWTSDSYAISHVVLTTERPTAVTVTDMSAERMDAMTWLAVSIITLLVGIGIRWALLES